MSNAELLQYKQYLQKYVFAGWEAPDDVKEWVRMLEKHIAQSDMLQEDVEEDVEQEQQGAENEDVAAHAHGGGGQCAGANHHPFILHVIASSVKIVLRTAVSASCPAVV